MARRAYGSGSLFVKRGRAGQETWYGRFWVGGIRVKRRIGPKRASGASTGLKRRQAERDLQRLIEAETRVHQSERVSLGVAAERYLAHLEALGRRPSTLIEYESYVRVHLVGFFGDVSLERIDADDVEAFIARRLSEGKAPKSIRNWLGLLHGVFVYAQRRRWCSANPCKLVELPLRRDADPDIRFLAQGELEALIAGTPDSHLGRLERVLYLTAAMTGLRQGELIALRWRDIDWTAGRYASAGTTFAADMESRSRGAQAARCRCPLGLPGSSSVTTGVSPPRGRRSRLCPPCDR